MPKILADIHNTILSSAEDLFKNRGFQETDMRQIAAHAHIAVGTIYHYYKNKEDLYVHVMTQSWQQTIHNLEVITLKDGTPGSLLKEMLQELVQGMVKRRTLSTLWTEISTMYVEGKPDFIENSAYQGMHTYISGLFSRVLAKMVNHDLNEQEAITIDRLGSFAFVMSVDLCMPSAAESENQVDLIADLLTTYLKTGAGGVLGGLRPPKTPPFSPRY